MVVVSYFAIVGVGRVEEAVLTPADAEHERIVMRCLLFTGQGFHFEVYFEVFDNLSLPSDELVEELVYRVFAREQIELLVERRD